MVATIRWDPMLAITGMRLQAVHPAHPAQVTRMLPKLRTLSGQTGDADAYDKLNFLFIGTVDGHAFALYDYRNDGKLHVGAFTDTVVPHIFNMLDTMP